MSTHPIIAVVVAVSAATAIGLWNRHDRSAKAKPRARGNGNSAALHAAFKQSFQVPERLRIVNRNVADFSTEMKGQLSKWASLYKRLYFHYLRCRKTINSTEILCPKHPENPGWLAKVIRKLPWSEQTKPPSQRSTEECKKMLCSEEMKKALYKISFLLSWILKTSVDVDRNTKQTFLCPRRVWRNLMIEICRLHAFTHCINVIDSGKFEHLGWHQAGRDEKGMNAIFPTQLITRLRLYLQALVENNTGDNTKGYYSGIIADFKDATLIMQSESSAFGHPGSTIPLLPPAKRCGEYLVETKEYKEYMRKVNQRLGGYYVNVGLPSPPPPPTGMDFRRPEVPNKGMWAPPAEQQYALPAEPPPSLLSRIPKGGPSPPPPQP